MPIPHHRNGKQSDGDAYGIVSLVTPVQLTSNVTNTATSATQVTGLTQTFTVPKITGTAASTYWVKVILSGDSVYNSGANSVILTAWVGTVGTGTQFGQSTDSAQSSAPSPITDVFYLAAIAGTAYTVNIGMHGSGAGTNTLVAGTTNPLTMAIELT